MRKKIIFISLLILAISSFGQNIISTDLYDKGVEYFNKNDFKTADSLFTASVELSPNIDAYYNLALSKLKSGDTCNFCLNLKKASILGDGPSTKYYNNFCSNNSDRWLNLYKKSDSVYLVVIKTNPNPDAFLNLALTEAKLGNKCEFCQYLDSAAGNNLINIRNYYKKSCCSSKTIQISDSSQNDFKIFNIISTSSCTNEIKECTFIKINQQNDTVLEILAPVIHNGYIIKVDTMIKQGEYKNTFYIDTISTKSEHVYCNSKNIKYTRTIWEVLPTFIGGEETMYVWLSNNIKYPQEAKETGVQGIVVVTFVVEKDGSHTGVQILKGIGGGCDEEAVRVINAMPKWKPGTQNGEPVRVQFTLPIRYSLE